MCVNNVPLLTFLLRKPPQTQTLPSDCRATNCPYCLDHFGQCVSCHNNKLLRSLLQVSLLLYGTYLAGLTSNVSLPPVNQSLTIMAAVCLVTASTAIALPVSWYLYAWPNLVYSMVSGAIFICTTAINCLLFVPQVSSKDICAKISHLLSCYKEWTWK